MNIAFPTFLIFSFPFPGDSKFNPIGQFVSLELFVEFHGGVKAIGATWYLETPSGDCHARRYLNAEEVIPCLAAINIRIR